MGVISVHAVVLAENKQHIVHALPRYVEARDVQRLAVHLAVDREGSELAKAAGSDTRRGKARFLQVGIRPIIPIVCGQNMHMSRSTGGLAYQKRSGRKVLGREDCGRARQEQGCQTEGTIARPFHL
jgi:hypothetical protein